MIEPLYVCVYVPEFPAQARLRLRSELAGTPVVILAGDPPLEEVCSVNTLASRLGVAQGMTRAELAQASSRAEAIRKDQQNSEKKFTNELTQVQKDSEAKIGAVATDVSGAKTDIAATRTDLEATKSKLDRAQGDMGVMSGLIARNHDDLEDLKRRGDRNYYEFTVNKSKAPQRVGPIQVNVNKTDQKKSKFTMTVFADDREIEKKDRTAGEPIQFYVGGTRMAPYEIVVFKVGKDQLTGYLSTPKDAGSAAAAPAATPAKQ